MDLYIDLETHPDLRTGAMQKCIDAVEPPGQYKKAESIAEWKATNAVSVGREQWARSALNPMCGGIYCIGYSVEGRAPLTITREPDEPEAAFLFNALDEITDVITIIGQPRAPRFIGWNLLGFDLPFLAKRLAIHGISSPLRLPVGARYNSDFVLDLMLTWSGFKEFNKQRDVAAAMGIPLEDDTDGKDLWAAVERDGVKAAAKKCRSDIATLIAIHRRMSPVFGV